MSDRFFVRFVCVVAGILAGATWTVAEEKLSPLPKGSIHGRVMDAVTGKPATNVVVCLEPTKQSLSGRNRKEFPILEIRTDEAGNYLFSDVPALTYNVWAEAENRTCTALNSIQLDDGKANHLADLQLVEGTWLEGRILTLQGMPISRNPQTNERLMVRVTGSSRPHTGTSFETTEVDDNGQFRLRVPPGRHFPRIMSAALWHNVWRKEKYERGIEVMAGQATKVNFRMSERDLAPPVVPPRPPRNPVKLPPPVVEEWDCAETIRDLGGWYELDADRHVVAINMVYNDQTGQRYDNGYTNSDEALRIAPAFPHLKKLYLHGAQATDDSMVCLAEMPGLEVLFVWNALAVTDDGARHLANLVNLESVHLDQSPVGDAALQAVAKLPKLRAVSMQRNAFTDAGMAFLAGNKQIRTLWVGLGKKDITDAGLAHLATMENLETLDIQNCKITDTGLECLKDLKKLKQLYLSDPVSAEGIAKLQEALPGLSISK